MAFICISAVSAAPGDNIYVDSSSGNDSWDGQSDIYNITTGSGPKISIKNATGTVNDNGTVYIANGVYIGTNNTEIIINKNMNIIGQSQTGTIIKGSNTAQIFNIQSGTTVTIQNLTLTNGRTTYGGAITNAGNLTIIDTTITQNTATQSGGGIHNQGNLNIKNTTITQNTAYVYGGGIQNKRSLIINNTTIKQNIAPSGGAIDNWVSSSLTITNTTITQNTATNSGGAILSHGTITITNTTITQNTAAKDGGAINNQGNLNIINTTITQNTATEDGGAIYNYYSTITLQFIRIVGNTAAQGNAIYNKGGTITAGKNWWGTNKDPRTIPRLIVVDGGSLNIDTWVILTVNSDPNTINNGQTTTITADFNHINSGGDLTGGHIPEGDIDFTTEWGSLTQYSSTTRDGEANTTFQANGSSPPTSNPVKVYSEADDEKTTFTSVNILITTIITADSVASYPGQNITLTAQVNDSYNNPLNIGDVTFKVNGTNIGKINVTSGLTTLNWTIPDNWNSGNYIIIAEYTGSGDYQSNSISSTLKLNYIPTRITLDPVNGYQGDIITLTAKIENTINNITLQDKIIDFYVNGTKIGSASIDENGTATYKYTILEKIGAYDFIAMFNGEEQFSSSNNNNTLTVNATPTKLNLNETLAYKGKTIKLNATLWDTYHNNAIAGQKVTFKVSGVVVGSATTNSNGVATLLYKDLTGKTSTIMAEFTGNNQYAKSENTNQIIGEKTFTLTMKNTGTSRIHVVYYVTVYKPGVIKPIFIKYNLYLNPGKTAKFNIGTYPVGTSVSVDQLVYNKASFKKAVSLTNTWTATSLKPYIQKFTVKNVPGQQKRKVYARNRFWINKNTLNVLIVRKPTLL